MPSSVPSATFPAWDPEDSAIGLFNGPQHPLGTVFRLAPTATQSTASQWIPVHTLSPISKVHSNLRILLSDPVQTDLQVVFDDESLSESVRAGAIAAARAGTKIVLSPIEYESIRDIREALASDPAVLKILETAGGQDRFVVTSSVAFAGRADVLYAPDGRDFPVTSFIAEDTSRVENAYIHHIHTCDAFQALNAHIIAKNALIPLVHFYTAVELDRSNHRVTVGSHQPPMIR